MRIVYPPEGHTTYDPATFFVGEIEPGATLTINQDAVPVSASGYFAWAVTLQPGENQAVLTEKAPDGRSSQETRTLIRDTGLVLKQVPDSGEALRPSAFPASNVSASPGDFITLFCPAPRGAEVTAEITGLATRPLKLSPLQKPVDTREGVFAHLHQVQPPAPYLLTTSLQIPENLATPAVFSIRYTLKQGDQSLTFEAAGQLTVGPTGYRRSGRVLADNTVIRTSPYGGSRLTPLLKGTHLPLSHLENGHYQVHLGDTQVGWVAADAIQLGDGAQGFSPQPVHTVHCRTEGNSLEIRVPLAENPLHQITAESGQVKIRLYNTTSRCDFIHYHPGIFEAGLAEVQWSQLDPATVELDVRLDSPLQGVQRHYDELRQTLIFSLQTTASLKTVGFTVVIDPGHGGSETGATAPDGTPEKDLNLTIVRLVADTLKDTPGLQVVLTRDNDTEVSLEDRTRIAREAHGNLLLSLHHNALPDGRDPLRECGVSTFYYHSFALPAARHFQSALREGTDWSDYGILYDSLHICRELAMPSLLLELGFLTHPSDAEHCLDPAHQRKTAKIIAEAVCRWIAKES